jgi:hypothetical protein
MDRQIRTWRTADGERLWLSMLVGALEQASQADRSAGVCQHSELARLRSQLNCPASPYPFAGSAYSLRN